MNHRFLIATLAAAALVACSPAPAPVSTSMSDPSNPNAPEGVAHAAPSTSTAPPPASDPHAGHHGHAGHTSGPATAADAGAVYVCPMHPEVTSTEPGQTCPKCNMKLVPKK
ncbi:MAG: hypothetical protein KIT84_11195 [Labilithrix sp.]|nr:hypothetical protein [Labilithrix sp.]MCW5811574.1 hypothetical protein [Labilithrix sp.]